MKRYVYENNINLIKSLYASDFWTTLKEEAKYYKHNNKLKKDNSLSKLKSLIDVIYIDPDAVDKALIAEMQDFYNEMQETQYINKPYYLSINNHKCSLDAIIGWKTLFQYHKGQEIWLEDLALIRGSKMGHLAFPVQKSSINQLRGNLLKDRIDYTLFDIKSFYNHETNLKLQKAYEQKNTRDWLLSFGSFNRFIDQMKLNYFVYSNSEDLSSYDVIDLSKPYRNSSDHCLEAMPQKIKIEDNYITNIIDYVKYYGENLSNTHSELMYDYYL
ncbi:DUF6994 family protein [Staphylococcus haemolyticus]|uniref:DUF6994 family protein n=1 Tax=Staphylococcus haemolyticus TaxID=1283 RepID=UPI001909F328|nr:hypothetical protein [Staphylococcus haemolyticus]MBK3949511.1 hypothetical protein [Staphylococcus haemolyticus]